MTKQEFMAFSLPYGLKVQHFDSNKESEHLCKIEIWHNEEVTISDGEYEYDLLSNDCFPILHPLSDLTKEIEHIKLDLNLNIESENYNYLGIINYSHAFFLDGFQVGIMAMPFFFIQKLIELHFDIARLIDKGEAIDVNTLETNPYK